MGSPGEGEASSMGADPKRFKDDAREVAAGYECGIGIGYNDIKEDDIIEFFEIVEVAATLD